MITFKDEQVKYEELTKAYHDCRKRKRRTENALAFEVQDAERLYDLYLQLNSDRYEIGRSIAFCVSKPVKREVFAADFRDRIVHHLVINRTIKYFEEEFIYDTYSCRKGKGTSMAVQRCAEMIAEASDDYTTPAYIVKCDLQSFFMTIDRDILYNKISAFLTRKGEAEGEDMTFTLALMKKIIYNEPQKRCIRKQPAHCWEGLPKSKSLFHSNGNKGLPIGNLTSQVFANFYLSDFDKYVKREGVEYYGRYVDDFFFIVREKGTIKAVLELMRDKLAQVGARLNPQKSYIQEVRKGVKFVGAVIKPHRIYVSNRTKGNFWHTLRLFESVIPSKDSVARFIASVNSYLGFMIHYKTYNIRRALLSSLAATRWYGYCSVNNDYSKLSILKTL